NSARLSSSPRNSIMKTSSNGCIVASLVTLSIALACTDPSINQPSTSVLQPSQNVSGWQEQCTADTWRLPSNTEEIFDDTPPTILSGDGYIVGWGNGDYGKSTWMTV